MGYSLENWCCLCCQHEEMMHHLFLSCSFSRKIWSHFFSKLGYNWSPPSTLQDLVASWLSLRFNLQSFGRFVLHAVFWMVWLERNNRILINEFTAVDFLISKVAFYINLWNAASGGVSLGESNVWFWKVLVQPSPFISMRGFVDVFLLSKGGFPRLPCFLS
ncbi:hypothetical protein LINPERHAP1_LOCUS13204 [Linum perenne]